ncbi:MAG: nucleotide-diphospho-sugar transferase [Methylicorpusculum sp.]|nr:nucleotide-diphospho-sugar transferase [Methylicorpusculum sp.]
MFLVFNRPDVTAQVFAAIRQAKPPRLYVAADGPRDGRPDEAERVARAREIATAVDWPCEVKTLFRDKNLGCKHAVSSAITWFFEQEEQGIILEDDCLPHLNFFSYCERVLNQYANDKRVMAITGDNFQVGQLRGDASYYFSLYNHVWGWASWRRAWSCYDVDMCFWPEWKKTNDWKQLCKDPVARRYWQKIFDSMYRREIDTWDYQWTASIWYHGGLTATPNVNLVSNIGFGPDSTHTTAIDSPLAGMLMSEIGEILHPSSVQQDIEADRLVFDHVFGGKQLRFPWSIFRLSRRVLDRLCRGLKQKKFV